MKKVLLSFYFLSSLSFAQEFSFRDVDNKKSVAQDVVGKKNDILSEDLKKEKEKIEEKAAKLEEKNKINQKESVKEDKDDVYQTNVFLKDEASVTKSYQGNPEKGFLIKGEQVKTSTKIEVKHHCVSKGTWIPLHLEKHYQAMDTEVFKANSQMVYGEWKKVNKYIYDLWILFSNEDGGKESENKIAAKMASLQDQLRLTKSIWPNPEKETIDIINKFIYATELRGVSLENKKIPCGSISR